MQRVLPWLIGALVFLLLVAFIFSGSLMTSSMYRSSADYAYGLPGYTHYSDPYLSGRGTDFAPEIEERQYSSTATLTIETARSAFDERVEDTRTLVTAAGGYLLEQNVREVSGRKTARLSIRVPDAHYDSVKSSLIDMGRVIVLEEGTKDVTGTYARTDIELEAERSRLERLETLYAQRSTLSEKLQVERAIFDQERKVRYLESQLGSIDQHVSYSTISLTLQTSPSAFAGHSFITLRDLIGILLGSLNALIAFLVLIGPWALVAGGVWWVVKKFR